MLGAIDLPFLVGFPVLPGFILGLVDIVGIILGDIDLLGFPVLPGFILGLILITILGLIDTLGLIDLLGLILIVLDGFILGDPDPIILGDTDPTNIFKTLSWYSGSRSLYKATISSTTVFSRVASISFAS